MRIPVPPPSLGALPAAFAVAYALLWSTETRTTLALLFTIGTTIGTLATFTGACADALVLPALLYTRLFTPRSAVATSMAVFLLPVQAFTVVRAYRADELDVRRVVVVALAFIAANWTTSDYVMVTGRVVRYVSAALLVATAVAIVFAPDIDVTEVVEVEMDSF